MFLDYNNLVHNFNIGGLTMNQNQKLQTEISGLFKNKSNDLYQSIALAYLAIKMKETQPSEYSENTIHEVLNRITNPNIREFILKTVKECNPSYLKNLLEYDVETLKDYILHFDKHPLNKDNEVCTPESIVNLALKLLDIQDSDSVIDNCSGVGIFLSTAHQDNPKAEYFGVEIDPYISVINEIRMSISDMNAHLEIGNGLFNKFGMKFDKAFSHFPFGLNVKNILNNLESKEQLQDFFPELYIGNSADWMFAHRLCQLLKPNGRAVAIMSIGSLSNTTDKATRMEFLVMEKLEAIIKLPTKMFSNTGIPVAMVVFGNNSNRIRFIDASELYISGRRQNTFSDEHINMIFEMMYTDTEKSRTVDFYEIASQDFSFEPSRYLIQTEHQSMAIELQELGEIIRGTSCSAKEIDDLTSDIPTDFHYITPANIKNGSIDNNVLYLRDVPKNLLKYRVQNGDLLISKNAPFRVAVADIPSDKIVIANSNFYIITLDKSNIDPYYIGAYFASDEGSEQLNKISAGTTLPSLSSSQLKTLTIPLRPLDEHTQIAIIYKNTLNEIKELHNKIKEVELQMKQIFLIHNKIIQ